MAKLNLRSNKKFLRLCRDLKRPPYQVRGLLEMMWESAYENDVVFDSLDDMEIISTWDGDEGVFGAAILATGFVDEVDGAFIIHDYREHAPYWWKERERKRKVREVSGNVPEKSGTTADTGASREEKGRVEKSKEETKTTPVGATSGFDEFWDAYPKKRNKGDAEKAWKKLHPPLATILAALDWQRQQPSWTKDGGQYVPYPASYLNAKGWEDEPVEPAEPFDPFANVTRAVTEEGADWMMGLTDVKPKSLGD